MADPKKVLLIGNAFIDVIAKVSTIPLPGEDTSATMMETMVGGCAYNIAMILQQFSISYDLLAPIGQGKHATLLKDTLVSTGHKILIEDPRDDNGWCLSLVDNKGERTFITFNGIEEYWQEGWFENIDFHQYYYVYLSGYSLEGSNGKIIIEQLQKYSNHMQIIFDPCPRIKYIDAKVIQSLFSMHPIIHGNEQEICYMANQTNIHSALEALFTKTNRTVIVTLNYKGCVCFDGTTFHSVDSPTVTVIDTIGAGDSHLAAFIACLVQETSLIDACRISNIVASQIVQVQGAHCSLDTIPK